MNSEECRSLASEGERALREGDSDKGIKQLEHALHCVSGDLLLLSSLHSQLGNAYYARRDYAKARFHHLNDLYASRMQKDELQQGKAYSNLSATYTLLLDVDNAIVCANNAIRIARKLDDKSLECRGIYSLGLAYLHCSTRGLCDAQDEQQLNKNLEQAIECFKQALIISEERQDHILYGLALGNLGNTYFYIGNYNKSIEFHEKRIELAKELGDRSSVRRSYTNIANAYVLTGDYENAIKFYSFALRMAREMKIPELERQINIDIENVECLIRARQGENLRKHLDDLTCISANTSFGFSKSDLTNIDAQSCDEDFFDRIERMNNKRITDQRAEMPPGLISITDRDSSSLKDYSKGSRFSLSKSKLRPVMKSFSNLKKFGAGTFHGRRRNLHDSTTTTATSIDINNSECTPSNDTVIIEATTESHANNLDQEELK